MSKRKKHSKLINVIVALVVLLVVAGGVMMFKNYVGIRGQHLNTYTYSSGGGMSGGYYRNTVKRYNDQALISIESAEWHSQDPTVTEYLVDASVLSELESVVRKNRMNFWNRKKFTNIFVSDGESQGYYFYFDDADISFSSQLYPAKYSKKLAELDSVVNKYIKAGEKLPGLVNPKKEGEENYSLPKGEFVMYVYLYAKNSLGLRILNGTDKDVEISKKYKIINTDTEVVVCDDDIPYGGIFYANYSDVMDIKLKDRLQAGNYKIILGDQEILFEIR